MLNYTFLYDIFYMAPATKFYPTSYYKFKSKLIAINWKYISIFYVKNTILNQNANNKDSNLTTRHFFLRICSNCIS